MSDCRHFDTCSAPICPLDESSLKNCTWFANEDICKLKQTPRFVRNQKTIQKRSRDNETYYTHPMLNRDFIIKAGITGIDPDQEAAQAHQAEKKWIKDHPEKKPLSDEQIKTRSEHMKKIRSSIGQTIQSHAQHQAQVTILG